MGETHRVGGTGTADQEVDGGDQLRLGDCGGHRRGVRDVAGDRHNLGGLLAEHEVGLLRVELLDRLVELAHGAGHDGNPGALPRGLEAEGETDTLGAARDDHVRAADRAQRGLEQRGAQHVPQQRQRQQRQRVRQRHAEQRAEAQLRERPEHDGFVVV